MELTFLDFPVVFFFSQTPFLSDCLTQVMILFLALGLIGDFLKIVSG